jgi:hypothetical protein
MRRGRPLGRELARGGTLALAGLAAVGLAGVGGAGDAAAQPTIEHRVAVLQALDKVTARIQVIEAPLGEEVRFGSLAIRASACYETPPTEPPESAAFLAIDDLGTDEAARETAFTGWMFASTPGISALEHPVFDVWVIDCREPVAGAQPVPVENAPEPPATEP